jgi:putative copper resistance protein D
VGLSIACVVLVLIGYVFEIESGWAQHEAGEHHAPPEAAEPHHLQPAANGGSQWEGSAEGTAYSEFNHHLAGLFVLLIGLSELSYALRSSPFTWARLLLPFSLGATGLLLVIWSDHDAWPIGSISFMESFFGQDHEILQHKAYGLMALAVGVVEILRRFGRVQSRLWAIPLPLFAIIGGLMLFGHSHGSQPAAHKNFLHHTIMGSLAGSSKLAAGWMTNLATSRASRWELLWVGLILLIGTQLLIYSE